MTRDDIIAPVFCQNCGQQISDSRRRRGGSPPKTCSEKCRKERASKREKARYLKVKDTDDWKATRNNYIEQHKQRLREDPEFAALCRAFRNEISRRWRARVDADSVKRKELLESKRAYYKQWREELLASPNAYAAYLEKQRAWYRSLTDEERERIFYAPRRRRTIKSAVTK